MKIALFTHWGDSGNLGMVPEGCPVEYAKSENRHKFALWLEENATEDGPFILERWEDGTITYEYMYCSEKFSYEVLVRAAIVNVDETRPWLIHNYDGWEEIWYADQRTEDNQILPQAVPAGVGSYRYGEIEEKKYELLAKIYGEEEDKEEDEEDEE